MLEGKPAVSGRDKSANDATAKSAPVTTSPHQSHPVAAPAVLAQAPAPSVMRESALQRAMLKIRRAFDHAGLRDRRAMIAHFKSADSRGEGLMEYAEFKRTLVDICPLTAAELRSVFSTFDSMKEGTIDYGHFLSGVQLSVALVVKQQQTSPSSEQWLKAQEASGVEGKEKQLEAERAQ